VDKSPPKKLEYILVDDKQSTPPKNNEPDNDNPPEYNALYPLDALTDDELARLSAGG